MPSTVQFSSVHDGIYALGKAYMRSIPSLRSVPNVTFETVTMFVRLTMVLSRPFKENRLALPLSTLLGSRRLMLWCPWLCARRLCLKLLNTSDLPRSKPLVSVALPTSQSICLACRSSESIGRYSSGRNERSSSELDGWLREQIL